MSVSSRQALLEARPPTTDFITYLTIVEYNLTVDVLPTLHEVLQDAELTNNIGWDLVHLLMPMLPASEECLQDVARLGNPREVVLKVTEALRLLEFADGDESEDEQEPEGTAVEGASGNPNVTAPALDDNGGAKSSKVVAPVLRFQACLSMLRVLHHRIKTKYPSRFLSTSLEAVLLAYKRASAHVQHTTESVVSLIKNISVDKRHPLPTRASNGSFGHTSDGLEALKGDDNREIVSAEERALQLKLLQSFLSHVLEDYMASLDFDQDVPGMAWSSRLQEKLHEEKIPQIPGRTTTTVKFADVQALQTRSSIVGQIVALADDLGLKPSRQLKTVLEYDPATADPDQGEELPSSADDVPFSEWGALYLFAANKAQTALYGAQKPASVISIFPEHARIVETYFTNPMNQLEAAIDAVLFLGLLAIESKSIGDMPEGETFTNYLLKISYLAANTPSPSLRYNALELTSSILHAHPSDAVRLSFIRDTLEDCPYENLKVSAVGWLKQEIISANLLPHTPSEQTSLFSISLCLDQLCLYLFPDLNNELAPTIPLHNAWMHFNVNTSLFLATLSFYYFLYRADPLRSWLDTTRFHKKARIGERYLNPLKTAALRFREALDGDLLVMDSAAELDRAKGELALVQASIEQVEDESSKINTPT